MKNGKSDELSLVGQPSTAPGLLEREAEQNKSEPIPLDVIASEMRRQSELLVSEKNSDILNSRRDVVPLTKGTTLTSADSRGPAISGPASEESNVDFEDSDPLSTAIRESEEQMDEYLGVEGGPGRFQNTVSPRKSSDVLTDRLIQLRRRAELAERQCKDLSTEKGQLLSRIETLEQHGAGADSAEQEREALRRELDLVRNQAAEELKALKLQMEASGNDRSNPRNVELEAELQALRQESAALRNAGKKKDAALEDLAAQCRGLEDQLEDREREMEKLLRDMGASSKDGAGRGFAASEGDDLDLDSLFSVQEKAPSKVFEGAGLIFVPGSGRPKTRLAMIGVTGLILGFILFDFALVLSGQNEFFSHMMASTAIPQPSIPVEQIEASTNEPASAAVQEPVTPLTATVATADTATASNAGQTAYNNTSDSPPSFRVSSDRMRIGSDGPLMVALPGGSFLMGSKRSLSAKEEQPAHQVRIKPFHIAKREVSFDEYDRFARASGHRLPDDAGWGRGSRPVINISWDDAQAYVRWLSQQTNKLYRLPSEAEWEYAARAGTNSRYWWGFSAESGHAVCFDCGSAWDNRRTAPTGSLQANPFGVQDTAGNAMEWVEDCYNANYKNAPSNGEAWLSGDCSQRMVRGGAFNKPTSSLRNSARYQLPRDASFSMLGFRVARDG